MEENMQDFTNIKCKEHPLQTITNFCLNQNCKVGLCSLCICHHTEIHVRNGTSPIYKPIKDIYEATVEKIKSHIYALEHDKDRIINMMKNITERKQSFREVMQQARKDVLALVDKLFEEMQMRFEQEVKQEKSKTGFHSLYQVQTLCKKVNRQIDNLVSECQILNSSKFVDIVRNIEVNTLDEAKKLHLQITQEIKLNEEFVPSLIYRKQSMNQLELCTRRLLSLTFFVPNGNKMYKKVTNASETKENYVRNNSVCEQIVRNMSMGPMNNLKQSISPQSSMKSSMRNSRIVEPTTNSLPIQILKNNQSYINLNMTPRSRHASKISFVPQFSNTANLSMVHQRRSMISDFNMTGDKFFLHYDNQFI